MTNPLLRMSGIDKHFPGVQALAQANLDVLPGEVHVLLGENGAGKSTLMKILGGVHTDHRGTMHIDGAIAELPPASTVSVTCSPAKGIDATMAQM